MARARKGDAFTCEVCGLVVSVDETCDCAVGEIICCDIPMKKGKVMKAKKKAGAKKVAKKKPAKKAAKKKVAKKKVAKKKVAKKKK